MKLGVVGYCPPKGKLNSDAFIANLSANPTTHPLYIYSDDPVWSPSRIITNPEVVGRRPKFAINNLIFLFGLLLARDSGLDWFIYIESDSRAGCPGWDERMFDEFFGRYDGQEIVCAGSPVCFDLNSGGKDFAMKVVESAFDYQRLSGLPASFHSSKHPFDSSGATYYPNGSCGIYHTTSLCKLFAGFDHNIGLTALQITPWDMEIGRRLWHNFGPATADKVGWIACAYSGYGDAVTTQAERLAMLADGTKAVVHQVK